MTVPVDALKRVNKSERDEFIKRVGFYMRDRASEIFEEERLALIADAETEGSGDHPSNEDMALAKAIYANDSGTVKDKDMTSIVITNSTIGNKIDRDELIELTGSEATYIDADTAISEGLTETVLGDGEVVVDGLVRQVDKILDAEIYYVVSGAGNKFNALALSYVAAGILTV